MSTVDQMVDDRIAAARLEKAKKIAAWLHAEFIRTVENCTKEERLNCAAKAGAQCKTAPSDESWAILMGILKGPK